MVGNLPRESQVVAIQKAIQDPCRLRKLEGKVDHLTTENQKTTKQLQKLDAEQQEFTKQVK
jgi:hypothetical protein